jgi:hypothetical protein
LIFAAVPVDILFANVPRTGLVWAVTVTNAEVENPITRATAIEVINIVVICYIRLFTAVMEFPLLNSFIALTYTKYYLIILLD